MVKQGRMGYQIKETEGFLDVGQTITIPAGVPHTFWNADFHRDMHAHMLLEITLTPALHAEEFFRTICGLAVDYGGTLRDVNKLQLMLTVEEGGVRLANMPTAAILASQYFLAPLARLLGFQAFYQEYCGHFK